MIGVGVKAKCGTSLVYRSRDLKHGTWGVDGLFCMYVYACTCFLVVCDCVEEFDSEHLIGFVLRRWLQHVPRLLLCTSWH
jgi:hypothetical protein